MSRLLHVPVLGSDWELWWIDSHGVKLLPLTHPVLFYHPFCWTWQDFLSRLASSLPTGATVAVLFFCLVACVFLIHTCLHDGPCISVEFPFHHNANQRNSWVFCLWKCPCRDTCRDYPVEVDLHLDSVSVKFSSDCFSVCPQLDVDCGYLEEEWVFYVILWNVFVLTSKCLEFMGVGSWRNSDMGQKLQPGRKQCNDQKHYSSANSAAHKQILDLLFFFLSDLEDNLIRYVNL